MMNMKELNLQTAKFLSNTLSIIPGPKHLQGIMDSQYLDQIEAYDIKNVADFFNNLSKVKVLEGNTNQWHEWKLEYQTTSGKIIFNLTIMSAGTEFQKEIWGGSTMQTDCLFSELVDFWLIVKEKFPFVYFHDADCNIYIPETFIKEYAIPFLENSIPRSNKIIKEINTLASLL